MNTQSYYKDLLSRFDLLSKKEYTNLSLIGLELSIIGCIQLFIVLSFIEMFWHLSTAIRTIMFFILLIFTIGLIGFLVIRPLFGYFNILHKPNYSLLAGKVGKNYPLIKDELVNALQLVSIGDTKIYSTGLVEAAFRQIYLKTKEINFAEIVEFNYSKKLFRFLVLTVVISTCFLLFIPGLSSASYRLINFNQAFTPPPKFQFEIIPGDAQVTKGENVKLSAKVIGPIPAEVNFGIKYSEETEYEVKTIEADSTGRYILEIPAVRNSFNYFVQAEYVHSKIYKITVLDKPIIRTLNVSVIPPAYANQPEIILKDNGNVTSLVGSRMEFHLSTTKSNIKKVSLFFNDSTEFPLQINGRNASGVYRIKKDENYQIRLIDAEDNQNENPVTYSIKALYDADPQIEMIAPNKNVMLGDDDRLPMLTKISDDFGFSKLILHYRLSASRYEPAQEKFSSIEIPISKNQKEEDVSYIWNLSQLNLATEDEVTYYLEILDNDNVSGPKSTSTSMFTVRVPSLDELFAEADKTQDEAEQKLVETLNDAKKLKDDLQKISQELKKDKRDITWEEKEKIEKTFDKFQDLENKVDNIKKNMSELQKNMQRNNLLSKETMEKYMELQQLFEELGSEEMKKAMEKMQQMLQNLNRDQVQKAMENMQFNEEQMKNSIERTMKLLKRVQIEQKLDEIKKRTEELTDKLNQLKEQTSKSNMQNEQEKNSLSEKQEDATEDMKNLEERMKDLQDKMNEFEDMPNEEMSKTMQEYQKQQNEKMSQQAQQQLMQGQKQQAQQNQNQLSQNMQQLNQQMQSMQQMMQQQNQRQVFSDMMKLVDNLLSLSKEQEQLKEQTKSLEPNSSKFNENAKQQNKIQGNMDKILSQLNKLSQKSFAISPEMGKALGKANQSMKQSTNALQNRNGSYSSNMQGQAMSSLNEAATLMKGAMESMMSGQGSGGQGLMSMMQQLQQLSGQQMGLNNMTQQIQQENMSMQQQAAMQRLAQQQELIRKSLEQLNNEAKMKGESKRIPANLDKVLSDMQEVVTDMRTEKLNDELIQKQERILSKLLDAQRSINERDFEKERKSNTGENVVLESPDEINLSAKSKDKIKDELLKAVQEGYSKDYEILIRKYFEELEKLKQ